MLQGLFCIPTDWKAAGGHLSIRGYFPLTPCWVAEIWTAPHGNYGVPQICTSYLALQKSEQPTWKTGPELELGQSVLSHCQTCLFLPWFCLPTQKHSLPSSGTSCASMACTISSSQCKYGLWQISDTWEPRHLLAQLSQDWIRLLVSRYVFVSRLVS